MKSYTLKMAEHSCGASADSIIISGKGEEGFRLVGGKCVKEKLSQVNNKQSQALPNIKRDQYKQLFSQPKPSHTSPDASDQV